MNSLTLIQFTDPHLLSDPTAKFAGISPNQRLETILAHIYSYSQQHRVDYIVCSGDVIHENAEAQHRSQAYRLFAEAVTTHLSHPVYVVPGNHDDPGLFPILGEYEQLRPITRTDYFTLKTPEFTANNHAIEGSCNSSNIMSNLNVTGVASVSEANHSQDAQVVNNLTAHYDLDASVQVMPLNQHWSMILLDSNYQQEVMGRLTLSQAQQIVSLCQADPTRHFLLMLHHNLITTGCAWLDSYPLTGRAEFNQLLQQAPNLRVIIHGHIHQEQSYQVAHAQVFSTPATSIQFAPASANFKLDTIAPGYRILKLNADGSYHSEVIRVDCHDTDELEHISGY